MGIRAVFFDIGETLINETRVWSLLADWLGIPHMTMFGVLGGLIAEGRDHREILGILRPDRDWKEVVAGFNNVVDHRFLYEDLYPDAVSCLENLRARGYFVGIAGNQPVAREDDLRAMNLPADVIATSGGWGARKPDRAFFEKIVSEAGCTAGEIAYVGDRVDNDVLPAAAAGLAPVHIVRGPCGYLQRNWSGVASARVQLKTLGELPSILEGF